jgi:serine/threonine protein kinase
MVFPRLETITFNKKIGSKLFYHLYDGVNQKTGERIFLKLLDKNLSSNEEEVLDFFNIVRIVSLLNSPYICKVHDYGKDQNDYYIITEPVEGKPLSALKRENLTYPELIDILLRISMTLRYAHLRGAVHGLLNPECIYISDDGAIKIDDFGFYLLAPYLPKKQEKKGLELAHYVAPEALGGYERIDGRADIYSLGVILFQLITGHLPFDKTDTSETRSKKLLAPVPSIRKFVADVPGNLEMLVSKSLNKNPENRFQNFRDFVEELKILKREFSESTEEAEAIEREFNLLHSQDNTENGYTHEFDLEPPFLQRAIYFLREIVVTPKYLVTGLGILILLTFLFANQFQLLFFSEKPTTNIQDISTLASEKTGDITETLESHLSDKSLPSVIYEDSTETPLSTPLGADKVELSSEPEEFEADQDITDGDFPVDNTRTTGIQPSDIHKASATFYLKSKNQPIEANVFIDGEFKGKADNQGKFEVVDLVPERTYTVSISKDGYSTVTQKFTAKSEVLELSFDLKPKLVFGTVILEAIPSADSIYVDGKLQRGKTPLTVNLAEGNHRIRFVNLNLNASWEKIINLKVGQTITVRYDFTQIETGVVAISLKNAAEYGFAYVYVDGQLWNKKQNTTPLKIDLPVGTHTITVKRDGFNPIPQDTVVEVEKGVTKYVSFTLTKAQ